MNTQDPTGTCPACGRRQGWDGHAYAPCDRRGGFDSYAERMQHLASSLRSAADVRPSVTVDAEVMALVYEVAAGKPGALDALRARV